MKLTLEERIARERQMRHRARYLEMLTENRRRIIAIETHPADDEDATLFGYSFWQGDGNPRRKPSNPGLPLNILIPGFSEQPWSMAPLALHLQKTSNVIILPFNGHARSSGHSYIEHAIESIYQALCKIRDEYNPPVLQVFGNSWGGWVGAYASRDVIDKLLMAAPPPKNDSNLPRWVQERMVDIQINDGIYIAMHLLNWVSATGTRISRGIEHIKSYFRRNEPKIKDPGKLRQAAGRQQYWTTHSNPKRCIDEEGNEYFQLAAANIYNPGRFFESMMTAPHLIDVQLRGDLSKAVLAFGDDNTLRFATYANPPKRVASEKELLAFDFEGYESFVEVPEDQMLLIDRLGLTVSENPWEDSWDNKYNLLPGRDHSGNLYTDVNTPTFQDDPDIIFERIADYFSRRDAVELRHSS